MANITDVLKEIENEVSELKDFRKSLDNLADVFEDQIQDLIATYVEGTKRTLKKDNKEIPAELKRLRMAFESGMSSLKKAVNEVERSVKSKDIPLAESPRLLKGPIKKLETTIKALKFEFPTDPKNPIAVRLSNGEEFVEALNAATGQMVKVLGGGTSGQIFEKSDGAEIRPTTATSGGKEYVAVVNPDGTTIGGAGGTSTADDADFTAGSTSGTIAQGVYESTPTSVTDGDVGAIGITQSREVKVSIEADNVGIGGGTQYTEDAAAAANPKGNAQIVVRADSLAAVTDTDGDNVALRGTNKGELYVKQTDAITETNSAAILADTANMDTNLGTIAGAVSGTEMQVDVVTSALPTGAATAANQTTIIGHVDGIEGLLTTIDADTGAIKTAVETIDNAISGTEMQVDVVAALPAGTNAIGKLAANSGVDIGDITLNNTWQKDSSSDWKYADINDASSGDNTIVAAQGAGNKIAVWAILIVSDGTTDVRWEDGAGGTAFTGQVPLQAREGYSITAGGVTPLFVGTANTLLNLELTAAVNVHGFVSYTVVT